MSELVKEYEVVVLSSDGRDLKMLDEEWSEVVDEDGNRLERCVTVEMNRQISIWQDIKSVMALIKVFREEKPDIIHSITPKAGLLCMIAAKWTRVPVRIHNFTGLIWPTAKGLKKWLLMAADAMTCRCATHVIPESNGVMNDLQKITGKKMKVLGYGNIRGVNMEYYSRRPEVKEQADVLRRSDLFTFLFVGRLVKDKGVDELIEAFERLHAKRRNCRLILVGYYEGTLNPISATSAEMIKNCDEIELKV